jgi:predicted nucleic acid-binding protein
MIVVDTNIPAYLMIPGGNRSAAAKLLSEDSIWIAPVLWKSEFRNILIKYLKRREFSLDRAIAIQAEAEDLVRDAEFQVESRTVLELAAASGCTAYDCEFIALAKELRVPLVTMDRQLLTAFPDIAVPLAA